MGSGSYTSTAQCDSEKERAVITNRHLGKRFVEVDSALPLGKGVNYFGHGALALRIVTFVGIMGLVGSTLAILANLIDSGWFMLFLILAVGSFAYRKHAERQYNNSLEKRHITLADLMREPKFTVYAIDAIEAQQIEASICVQLNDIKEGMVRVAPGLAEKQVYDYGR